MKLRPSRFRGLVPKLAVPPLLLFAPHLVNYHLFKVCVYESWLIFSCLPLQYYFVRCSHTGLFQVFNSGLLKGQCSLLKGFSQLSRDARLVWTLAMGPSYFFLERVLFSLGTFVLCQKSISPWQWWGWRRESPRGWNKQCRELPRQPACPFLQSSPTSAHRLPRTSWRVNKMTMAQLVQQFPKELSSVWNALKFHQAEHPAWNTLGDLSNHSILLCRALGGDKNSECRQVGR